MVEPVSLATAVVSLLAPFLRQLGGQVAEKASAELTDAALPAIKRLYHTLKERLRPGSYARSQLQGVEERPDSEGRQQALRSALAEELESDPAFAAEVERLVSEAQAASGVQITANDTGVVAGRDVHQRGQYVAGRDLHIGDADRDRR